MAIAMAFDYSISAGALSACIALMNMPVMEEPG